MLIYKICRADEWADAVASGHYHGSAHDKRDGFIHFSTAAQAAETAAKHFKGLTDLVLIEIDAASLGEDLRWEPSRGGALFPHLYAPLPAAAAITVRPLALAADGTPIIPGDITA